MGNHNSDLDFQLPEYLEPANPDQLQTNHYNLIDKRDSSNIVGKIIQQNNKENAQSIEQIIDQKLENPSPFVTQLIQSNKYYHKTHCSEQIRFRLLLRAPQQTLAQQNFRRKSMNQRFSILQIDNMINRGAKGLKYLHSIGHTHKNISKLAIQWPSNNKQIKIIDEWAMNIQNQTPLKTCNFHKDSIDISETDNEQAGDLFNLGLIGLQLFETSYNPKYQLSRYKKQAPNPIQQQLLRHKLDILLDRNPENRFQIYRILEANRHTHVNLNKPNHKIIYPQKTQSKPVYETHKTVQRQQNSRSQTMNHSISFNEPIRQNANIIPTKIVNASVSNHIGFIQKKSSQNVRFLPNNQQKSFQKKQIIQNNNYTDNTQKKLIGRNSNFTLPDALSVYTSPIRISHKNQQFRNSQQISQTNNTHNEKGIYKPKINFQVKHPHQDFKLPYQTSSLNHNSQTLRTFQGPNYQNKFRLTGSNDKDHLETNLVSSYLNEQKQLNNRNLNPMYQGQHQIPQILRNIQKQFQGMSINKNQQEIQKNKLSTQIGESEKNISIQSPIHKSKQQDSYKQQENYESYEKQQQINNQDNNIQSTPNPNMFTTIVELSESANSVADQDSQFVSEEYQNGSKYIGYKSNNMRNGKGKFYYQEGSFYDGEWKNNNMHGYGKLYYSNNKLAYQGQWYMDQFHGKGKVYNDEPQPLHTHFDYTNFETLDEQWDYYEGTLVSDSKQGYGTLVLSNGQRYEGGFQNDNIHGRGKFYTLNGQIINGIWKNSLLEKII